MDSIILAAKEIGQNESYQKYLITIRQVEAEQAVGIAQAGALSKADVKVITNSGSPTSGLKGVMDLFSSKGGTEIASMVEAVRQTEAGAALVDTLTGGKLSNESRLAKKTEKLNGNSHA